MTDAGTLNRQLIDAANALENAQAELEERVRNAVRAEASYRKAKSQAVILCVGRGDTVAEREALAEQVVFDGDMSLTDMRYARDLAEGLRISALEAVRNGRQIVSALQTVANLSRSEAEFARTDTTGRAA